MKRESLVFFLGMVIVLVPFLGVPSAWKRIVYIMLGLILVLVGYQLRRRAYLRSIEDHTGERKTDVYVEQVAFPAAPEILPDAPAREEHEIQDSREIMETRPRRMRTKKV